MSIISMLRSTFLAACAVLALAGASASAAEQAGPISSERAREIALAQTGGGDVLVLDRHYGGDGLHYYRLEILNERGAYHVEIDESDGRLVQFIRKHGPKGGVAATANVVPAAGGAVDHERALAIALEKTGGGAVVESEVHGKKRGRIVHEFEIINNGVKYEIDIDGATGNVLKFKQKGKPLYSAIPDRRLDAAAAQAIALDKTGGGVVDKYELDSDDGRLVHEMEITSGNTRYEVEVDDASGAIVEFSID